MVIGKNASATDMLRWQFFIMGASAYILQMSENLRRSLMFKVTNGQVIGPAPCAFENFVQSDGKHSIRKKEPEATYLRNLFELYAIGSNSTSVCASANLSVLRFFTVLIKSLISSSSSSYFVPFTMASNVCCVCLSILRSIRYK